MDVLVISGSTRRGSFNTRLAHLVRELRPLDQVVVHDGLAALPFFDAEVEAAGVPPAVSVLRRDVAVADVVVFVTPEYNGSVPGVLANAVDWLSRPHGASVLRDKRVLVLSASPSRFGAVRAADHLRAVLERIGAQVLPGGLSVASAHQRLIGAVDPAVAVQLADVLDAALGSARGTATAAGSDLLPA